MSEREREKEKDGNSERQKDRGIYKERHSKTEREKYESMSVRENERET